MAHLLHGSAAIRIALANLAAVALLAPPLHAQQSQAQQSKAPHERTAGAARQQSQWGSGKNLYDKVCGHCHEPSVGVGTAIQGRGLPVEYVTFIVRNGINGMPAFPASYIDDASIAQVTEYIASLPAPAQP